jgi:S1-C subfamily serine protease
MGENNGKNRILVITILLSLAVSMKIYSPAMAANNQDDNITQYQSDDEESQPKKMLLHFTSGTGFYVTSNYIITNEHVVRGCSSISIRGGIKPTYASVRAVDKVNDLALLKTPQVPERIAQLRGGDAPLKKGEEVTVMGYPLERGIRGQYLVKKAVVTDTHDIYDGTDRIEFTDSVEKGNSGGPLMDNNGNVVGVVVGKMSFYLADDSSGIEAKPVKTSSMAISLESLRSFLTANKVYYSTDNTIYNYPDKWVEHKAKKYIVNVHCVKD